MCRGLSSLLPGGQIASCLRNHAKDRPGRLEFFSVVIHHARRKVRNERLNVPCFGWSEAGEAVRRTQISEELGRSLRFTTEEG